MNATHISKIASELGIAEKQVTSTVKLLKEDATVPFIARYRKEMTGSLDEVAITSIRDRILQLEELDKRREAILKSLEERDLLTDDLKEKVDSAQTLAELEDIYLPFRPKRRTRATIAKEKGLEPLAIKLYEQAGANPEEEAKKYLTDESVEDEKLRVETIDDALAGARDIIAEIVNEDQKTRKAMRELFSEKGNIVSSVLNAEDQDAAKYKDYFEWSEEIKKAPSHRILAIFRGEREGHLSVRVAPEEQPALTILEKIHIKSSGDDSEQVRQAVQDCYKRLLSPSMENEIRSDLKQRADEAAIRVFAENLRELLLASPLGEKRILAIDPGYRTGCKVVFINESGKLLDNTTIFITSSDEARTKSEKLVREWVARFKPEAIAIGNGTASRETESFINSLKLDSSIAVVMVNESGASVYSASDVARAEFPDKDVTVRGAVSIGRRLMDPLAELVKIDPKSIGVGQYQHDVDQGLLRRGLDDVVISCVNKVGVDVNTASPQLLSYVSGLGTSLAENIVKHRENEGQFKARVDLLKVARLGPKAFEQAAGFLRIRNGEHPLDSSAVHPESYEIVEKMARDMDVDVQELITNESVRKQITLENYVSDKVGLPTLNDIMEELAKPGRDPREKFEQFSFTEGVEKITDLKVGMKLPGIVTNVTAFGAFVDVGVHQDGLVHISQLADKFVSDASEIVKVGQVVEVSVLEVDVARKRISLSMKKDPFSKPEAKQTKPKQRKPSRNKKRHAQQPKQEKTDRPDQKKFSNNPFASLKDLKK